MPRGSDGKADASARSARATSLEQLTVFLCKREDQENEGGEGVADMEEALTAVVLLLPSDPGLDAAAADPFVVRPDLNAAPGRAARRTARPTPSR